MNELNLANLTPEAAKSVAIEIIENLPNDRTKVSAYSQEKRIIALSLRAAGYTMQSIADELAVAKSTVHAWINAIDGDVDSENELSEQIKARLAGKLYRTGNTVLSSITQKDIKTASLQQKMTSVAIAIDKARLIEGNSTENVAVLLKQAGTSQEKASLVNKDLSELDRQIQELERRAAG